MKRTNVGYVAAWYGGLVGIHILLIVLSFALDVMPLFLVAVGVLAAGLALLPGILHKRMEKAAVALEKSFAEKKFTYQYKFTSNNSIFYIDEGGKLGIVWKYNPTELQFADLSNVTDIRTHDGKQLRGTSLVSCQFMLEGRRYKIYTLRVSNGQFSMQDPRVLEAISKADHLCELLQNAKAAARGTRA